MISSWLRRASLVYLTLPIALFFIGWLKPQFMILGLAALGVGFVPVWRAFAPKKGDAPFSKMTISQWAILFALVIAWVGLSGMGGLGFQNGDYEKHNAILKDLTIHAWPSELSLDLVTKQGEIPKAFRIPLCYYFAFYLPAAFVGKAFGWSGANAMFLLWGWLGTLLSALWFIKLVNRFSIAICLLLVFFSGMDIVGCLLFKPELLKFGGHFEWWAEKWQYSSNTTQLYWVPQHCLAGWILTGLAFNEIQERRSLQHVFYLASTCILWSPFVALGLIPLLALGVYQVGVKSTYSIQNLLGLVVVFFQVAFMSANLSSVPNGIVWTYVNFSRPEAWTRFLLFPWVDALLLLAPVAWLMRKEKKEIKLWLLLVAVLLVVIPFYMVGINNDWVMRSSIPAIFLLTVWTAKLLSDPKNLRKPAMIGIIVFLIVGAATPISEMIRSIQKFQFGPDPIAKTLSTNEMGQIAAQYLGSPRAFFFRVLARQHPKAD